MKAVATFCRRVLLLGLILALWLSFSNAQISFAEDVPAEDISIEEVPEDDSIRIVIIDGKECVGGEVLVSFKDDQSNSSISYTLESFGSQQKDEPSDDMVLTRVPEGETVEEFIKELAAEDNVTYVQPNYIYRIDTTVNDPAAQLPNPDQWHLETINAYAAWDTTMGSAQIKVAVIDTGIDLDHPDLIGRVYMQTDTVDNDNDANDDDGHGTHVAGIIAANDNNSIGVVGVAPNVRLIIADVFGWYSVETSPGVFEDDFFALDSDIIEAVNYSVANGADVINMSFGDYEDDEALHQALSAAVSSGVICVASAGNDGITDDHYPSDYSDIVSVIWTNEDDTRNINSNYGSSKDIAAPGNLVLSTYWKDDNPEWEYAYASGTSMASPIVAAVAALVLSVNPELTVDEVKNILYSSAVDLGAAGRDNQYGYGRVDAQAAVLSAMDTVFSQGVGTKSNPYLIYTPMQLNGIRYFPKDHFRLGNDIDLGALMHDGTDFYNDGKGWEPIPLLSGSFDGDGYSINGLLCNRPGEVEVGLFKRIDEDAVVENLDMNGHDIVGSEYAGAIAAFNYGTIQNCHTDGSVYTSGRVFTAGGIAGCNEHEILNCSSAGTVYKGGGIVGKSGATTVIDSCLNYAEVTGAGAGIVWGIGPGSVVSNCSNFGTISGHDTLGGIVGHGTYVLIENCFNAGTVGLKPTDGWGDVGGIVGSFSAGQIINCFNVGQSYAPEFGSIIGYASISVEIKNCYNANYQTYSLFYDSYDGCTLTNSYFLYDGSENLGPTAKTSAELKMQSTYETYDFSSIWSIVEGERFAVHQGLPFTYVTELLLDKESVDIFVGQDQALTADLLPADATNTSILWTSSNESVAEVNDGVVAGVSTGTATISATSADGTFVDSCTVNVQQGVIDVWIDKETLSLVLGTQGQLNATVWPSDAHNKNVAWISDDENIATVSQEGLVTAVAEGITTVTVTTEEGGFTDSCTVYVTLIPVAVSGVNLNVNSAEMVMEDTLRLIYTLNPVNATNSSVTWSSTNESVVAVVDGTVTAGGAGSATITVTTQDGDYTATCTVTVKSAKIESAVYTVGSDGTLNGVKIGTTTAQLIAALDNDSADIKVYDIAGNEYTGEIVCTGMTVKLIVDGTVRDELTIIILGDANGDGSISIMDYTLVRLDILGLKALGQTAASAADINGDGAVTIMDYTLIRLDILGLKKIH